MNADATEAKRWLASMCRHMVTVLDATKWAKVGITSFAIASHVNTVIDDVHVPADLIAQLRVLKTEILLV